MQGSGSAGHRRFTRVLAHCVLLVAVATPASAFVGRVAGVAGASSGSRFRVTGVSSSIHQAPGTSARFVVSAFPLQSISIPPADPLFANGFE